MTRIRKMSAAMIAAGAMAVGIGSAASAAPSGIEQDTRPCVAHVEYNQLGHFTRDWSRDRFDALFDVAGKRDTVTAHMTEDGRQLAIYAYPICGYSKRAAVLLVGFNPDHEASISIFWRSFSSDFSWANTEPKR